MIKKVLIAEDHESANLSVQKTLEEAGISQIDYVYYCDDGLAKVTRGKETGQPYDLLITDLYFEEDHRKQQIIGGQALIAAARNVQPALKVLVFSAERKVDIVQKLFDNENIDGYVRKARNDAKELKSAIEQIGKNLRYFPWWYVHRRKDKNAYEFTTFDVAILSLLADGVRQKEMPPWLRKRNMHPSGISSIEKRLNRIRDALGFSNNEQLIAYCKEMGII
jgi:two-component system capsular synthesis response regulator RcsB